MALCRPTWNFRLQAKHEAEYYNWLDWMVCHPAASAVNAVRDKLYQLANTTVPEDGYSRTDIVHDTTGGGAADIIHSWSKGPNCTPHELKRAKVLRVDGESVLDYFFEQTGAESGYRFRSTEVTTLKGKGKNILSQAGHLFRLQPASNSPFQIINEMIAADTGHGIICAQEQYVMVRLTDTLQLEISPVYSIRESTAQVRDAEILVLFYTHAALGVGKRYSVSRASGITAMRITLPAFPTSLFQSSEGIFRGGIIGRTKLISKSRASFSPLPWVRFDGDVQSTSNGVTIAYGRLIFLFVASRSLVTKSAHGPSATQRLVREYDAYAAMRTLQGAAIPKVIGMFTSKDGRNTVLMMSYAGKALRAFSELKPRDKLTLFHRLVRLHKTGMQRNDLEPRNVTQSSSGAVDD
ncbi:hypothetical protein C8J57DRAFT_1538243 [Mycena rebaudengoi]|nr:hypothetical protein C8J57DRAFT_1538243 [Mycena rebaudengoi]